MRLSMACAMFALMAACGGGSPTTPGGNNNGGNNGGNPPGSTSNQIAVGDNFFDPSSTTVAMGATVTWTWNGSANHNVTFDNANVGNSSTQSSGNFSRTFASAGTFNYHCTVHGTGMSGTVTVQ